MKDQLRLAEQKGLGVKVSDDLSGFHLRKNSHAAESYAHGRFWTVKIFVLSPEGYIGK
jgi:hypothetical protein